MACRSVIIFFALLVFVQSQHKTEKLLKVVGVILKGAIDYKANCTEQSQATTDSIDKFWNLETDGEGDPNLKCYLKCVLTETKITDESGLLPPDSVLHKNFIVRQLILSYPELIQGAIDSVRVVKVVNGDKCEAAFQLFKIGFDYIRNYKQ